MHVRRLTAAFGRGVIPTGRGSICGPAREYARPTDVGRFWTAAREYARPTDARPTRRSRCRAFTLIELLAVIAIMGLIAAMVGPTLTHFRKGDAMLTGTRQMLDAVGRARQLAISERTTVYMVFVPANFWNSAPTPAVFLQDFTPEQKAAVATVVEKQLTGYAFLSLRSMGDQPGRYTPRYLSTWQSLPEGTFIAPWKFITTLPGYIYRIANLNSTNRQQYFDVCGFQTNAFPFPNENVLYNRSPYRPVYLNLPFIAFNYLGQLASSDGQLLDRDEFIPLAHGSVSVPIDENRVPIMSAGALAARESPPWNSTNSYNVVHIDRLTGRARLEHQEVQ